jgi:hypothetical protein
MSVCPRGRVVLRSTFSNTLKILLARRARYTSILVHVPTTYSVGNYGPICTGPKITFGKRAPEPAGQKAVVCDDG